MGEDVQLNKRSADGARTPLHDRVPLVDAMEGSAANEMLIKGLAESHFNESERYS